MSVYRDRIGNVVEKKIVARTHEQIDQQFDWYDRNFGGTHDNQRRMAHEVFDAEVQEIKQLKDAAGINVAEAIEDRAGEERDAALEAVMRQEPRTLHGVAAYAAVAASQVFTDHNETAIRVLAKALKTLADAVPTA